MIKKGLFVLSLTSFMMADTTMCFKKDWIDPSTIETTTLDGGKCASNKSLVDMKKDGWAVEDIKISSGKSGMNFMYVLKKGGSVILSDGDLEARLNKIQDKREEKAKKVKIAKAKANGGKIYKTTCASCHGLKGEKRVSNSNALNSMSIDEIEIAMRDYRIEERTGLTAMLMKPYADLVQADEVKSIAQYIKTLK